MPYNIKMNKPPYIIVAEGSLLSFREHKNNLY